MVQIESFGEIYLFSMTEKQAREILEDYYTNKLKESEQARYNLAWKAIDGWLTTSRLYDKEQKKASIIETASIVRSGETDLDIVMVFFFYRVLTRPESFMKIPQCLEALSFNEEKPELLSLMLNLAKNEIVKLKKRSENWSRTCFLK